MCGGLALFLPDILNKLKRLRMETSLNKSVCDVFHFGTSHLEDFRNATEIVEKVSFNI